MPTSTRRSQNPLGAALLSQCLWVVISFVSDRHLAPRTGLPCKGWDRRPVSGRAHLLGSFIDARGPRPHLLSQPGYIRAPVGGRVVGILGKGPQMLLLCCPASSQPPPSPHPYREALFQPQTRARRRGGSQGAHGAGPPGSSADSLTPLEEILETGPVNGLCLRGQASCSQENNSVQTDNSLHVSPASEMPPSSFYSWRRAAPGAVRMAACTRRHRGFGSRHRIFFAAG